MASSSSSNSTPALAFVWFPGAPYTQRAALSAAKAALDPQGWRIIHPSDDDEAPTNDEEAAAWIERNTTSTSSPRVALFMDYDLIPWQHVQSRNYCVSSYCIRKALIRKNWLHTSVHAYSVKAAASSPSPLALLPRSWSVELQFADDLDELLIDELYDLAEMLEAGGDGKKRWFILKAAMADRGMGIRIFSSLDGLRRILEEFEEQDTSDGEEENQEGESSSSAVALGQLRHFVIQEYISTPLLIAPPPAPQLETNAPPLLRKFHLRAYVVCVAGLQVYLCDEMLALFAPREYALPPHDEEDEHEGEVDARVHLTNTCLHAQEDDAETGQVNVHLLSSLCENGAPSSLSSTAQPRPLTREDLTTIRRLATTTIGSAFSAAAKGAGATGWQTWEQSWEVFGVDLLVGRSEDEGNEDDAELRMWLLEVNAQPDFAQSGDELSSVVEHALKRAIEVGVLRGDGDEDTWKEGESRDGLTLCYKEKMRGAW